MIGGEFEIGSHCRSGSFTPAPDTYYYASGRSALYQILKSLAPRRRRVWLPDYLCHTLVEAVANAGYDYAFYALDAFFMVSPSALEASGYEEGDIILIINYFGLQDLRETAKALKDAFPHAIIVEDDVQAFFSFAEEPNPFADYRFTSLRKSFPVPDGGLVFTKHPMPVAVQPNSFSDFKRRASEMKAKRGEDGIRDEEYLALFEKGESLIDDNFESGMSGDSMRLFSGIDFTWVKKRRRENASHLLKGLETLGIEPMLPVPEDKVPLFIPILLPNRDEVRRRMFANEVFCPVHWPIPEGMNIRSGRELAHNELSLIVDQRYLISDMDLLLHQL